ncbi:hypothetical protein GGR58DRAFT_490570 [Xylaria digitata]|nr:hypothetical protein GGR58DRAFT_490570 [Xylaria digitata]
MSLLSMRGDKNAREILSKAGLQPLELVRPLAAPIVPSFESDLPTSDDEARALLVEVRTKDPNYVPPSEQRRHFFRSPKAKRTVLDDRTWTFNKHEIATALDGLLSQRPLSHPGIVQALMSHAGDTTLEELWHHLYDPDLEKRMKKGERITPLARHDMTWLHTVVAADRLDYISLLCSRGPGQRALDQAFTIALSKNAYEILKLLLGYGAIAHSSREIIREKICNEDITLVRLLLSASSSMNTSAWNYCIEPAVRGQCTGRRSHEILLLVLPRYPFPDSVDLLYEALKSEDIIRVSILLAYGNIEDNSAAANSHAFQIVAQIRDHARRYEFLDLLLKAGMHSDEDVLREELFKGVQRRHDNLVQLLVKSEVGINIAPHDSLYWAVSKMDFEMLEILKHGKLELPTSYLWDVAPTSASETDLVRLAKILNDLGGVGEPLDRQLLHAAKRKHAILAHCLVQYGASAEFQDAAAIKTALDSADLDMLEILLQGSCSREVLSTTVLHAMKITPRGPRLRAMKALMVKGVEDKALDVPLQMVAREGQGFDSELMNMLLTCGASVDYKSENGNTIAIAVQMRDMAMLELLCEAGPSMETMCNALVTVSGTFSTMQLSMALDRVEKVVILQ